MARALIHLRFRAFSVPPSAREGKTCRVMGTQLGQEESPSKSEQITPEICSDTLKIVFEMELPSGNFSDKKIIETKVL